MTRSRRVPASSDTALGDWYVNRVVAARQPLLLLVSSTSLLPMLIPARDVRGLPTRLVALVEARLRRCGLDDRTIAAETRAMASVAVGPTVDRSVLGIMVDFAKAVPYHLAPGPPWADGGPGGARVSSARPEGCRVSSPVSPAGPHDARLRGGAPHEAERRCGARDGGAGRAGAGRLRLLRQILNELVPGLEQFLFVDDVVAVEDGAALVAGQEHGDPLGDTGADQVAGGGAAAVVEEAGRYASRLTGGAPRRAPAADLIGPDGKVI